MGLLQISQWRNIQMVSGQLLMEKGCTLPKQLSTRPNRTVQQNCSGMRIYMLFQNNNSFLPERPGVLATPAVFIAVTGNCLTQSWINNRWAVMGKCLNPKMAGKLKGSRIRKGIISMQRDMGETSGISKERLTGSSDGRRRFTQHEAARSI